MPILIQKTKKRDRRLISVGGKSRNKNSTYLEPCTHSPSLLQTAWSFLLGMVGRWQNPSSAHYMPCRDGGTLPLQIRHLFLLQKWEALDCPRYDNGCHSPCLRSISFEAIWRIAHQHIRGSWLWQDIRDLYKSASPRSASHKDLLGGRGTSFIS